MYTFVPLVSLFLLVLLAACPSLFWPLEGDIPTKHAPYFPSPIPEVVLSAALWSFGYLLRNPIYTITSFILQKLHPIFTTFIFHAIYVFIYNILRLSSLPILHVRQEMQYGYPSCHDPIFRTVWWLAIGWAIIDVSVSIVQSYTQLALYRNVMVTQERAAEILAEGTETPQLLSSSQEILPLSPRREDSPKDGEGSSRDAPTPVDEAIRLAVDQDLEQLVNLKEREDVEEIYGIPIIVSKNHLHVQTITNIFAVVIENPRFRLMSSTYSVDTPLHGRNPDPLRRIPKIQHLQAYPIQSPDTLYGGS